MGHFVLRMSPARLRGCRRLDSLKAEMLMLLMEPNDPRLTL